MSKHFKKEELARCFREKGGRCSECKLMQPAQKLPDGVEGKLDALTANVLEPLRERYGKPITVNSGYRCQVHNKTVGGAINSQHTRGEAADITAGSPEENLKLARLIAANGRFDQMILYVNGANSLAPRFVHVSWKKTGANRGMILKSVRGDSVKYRTVNINELNK